MGIASSANYEQCHVPLENCCFDAALMYGIRISSRQCVPPLSNNDAAPSESESSLGEHQSEKRSAF